MITPLMAVPNDMSGSLSFPAFEVACFHGDGDCIPQSPLPHGAHHEHEANSYFLHPGWRGRSHVLADHGAIIHAMVASRPARLIGTHGLYHHAGCSSGYPGARRRETSCFFSLQQGEKITLYVNHPLGSSELRIFGR
ncbi:hypothetical protein [Dyella sp.]|uniref:hypothetical protein n=1 Tax=Dyella sp. TaxID=1869338 RepID=UPI002ED3CF18